MDAIQAAWDRYVSIAAKLVTGSDSRSEARGVWEWFRLSMRHQLMENNAFQLQIYSDRNFTAM